MLTYKLLIAVLLSVNYQYVSGNINVSKMATPKNIFQDDVFWEHFKKQVLLETWKCNFPNEILQITLDDDAQLYEDDVAFQIRRKHALDWNKNSTEWTTLILGACKEIANQNIGPFSRKLQSVQVFEALDDFVQHLNYFYIVADEMARRGYQVKVFSQYSSNIHDIDKLDPVMLTAYSERFEDNKTTLLWDACVTRHTHVNYHHQAHSIWHKNDCTEKCISSLYCNRQKSLALLEMISDKVSRRLQKNLHGNLSEDMWNVDTAFYNGLPDCWIDEVENITEKLKKWKTHTHF